MKISKDKAVSVEFVLTDGDGDVLDDTQGTPLTYVHGYGFFMEAVEKLLEGSESGAHFEFTLQPEEHYGQWDEEGVRSIDRQSFGDEEIEPGMQFEIDSGDGPWIGTVVEISDEDVVMDFNHPLAGRVLNFNLTVAEVRESTEEERQAGFGHVHGDDCGCD